MEKEGIYMYQLNVIDGMGMEGKTRSLNRISQKGWRLTGGGRGERLGTCVHGE